MIVLLSATSGMFCTFSFIFIQPVQSNVNTNLPNYKLVQRDSQPIEQDIETIEQATQKKVNLTLADAVNLALQNNRTIKNSYLQRIIDRQELAVAEDVFVPNFIPLIRPWVLRASIKYSEQVGKNLHLFPSNGEIKYL